MNESLGFSVRIFVPSGDPEGMRVIEKSNWTGQGLIFPRSLFAKVRQREELTRTGVYILWEPGRSGQLPHAYVGEGDVLLPRLDSHAKNKDFWTHGVAFTSKDQSLNKAHVQHLEARLVQLAAEAKRCELDNANIPQAPELVRLCPDWHDDKTPTVPSLKRYGYPLDKQENATQTVLEQAEALSEGWAG